VHLFRVRENVRPLQRAGEHRLVSSVRSTRRTNPKKAEKMHPPVLSVTI